MRAFTASAPILLVALAVGGFSQTTEAPQPDYQISPLPEVADPTAQMYLKFFSELKNVGQMPFSPAVETLGLKEEEISSLLAITANLAAQSRVFAKTLQPLIFESRMEIAETDTVSPALRERISNLEDRWSQTILAQAQRLRSSLGDDRFRSLDEFIHSGKPLFERVMPKATVTLNGIPQK